MNRRVFFQRCLALAALGFAQAPRAGQQRKVLVMLELKGGNDSLNTFVPYTDRAYFDLRPTIAIPPDQVIALDDRIGLNPALAALVPAWSAGELGLVQGLGYPQPNRSHFRSIEIWDTGSASNEHLDSGWLARALAGRPSSGHAVDGIVLGGNASPLTGSGINTVVMRNIHSLLRQAGRIDSHEVTTANPALQHILAVQSAIHRAADQIRTGLRHSNPELDGFPRTQIGRHLEDAARLILANVSAPVIKVSLGGFDTHGRQRRQHDSQLRKLAGALAAFRDNMMAHRRWGDVMVMSYSEFGRRAAENGSQGTDHGTAATHLVMGGRVRGGLFGDAPALDQLDRGDLVFTTDFRRLYNSVLTDWLDLPALYPPREHPSLGFIRS